MEKEIATCVQNRSRAGSAERVENRRGGEKEREKLSEGVLIYI